MAQRRGRLIVIAGPSGVGKGSVVKELLSREPDGLVLSVSATTRPPRPGELDGRDYSFVSHDRFEEMAARGALLEWAEVFGNKYGTPADFVDVQLANEKDVILEIDVQGARQIRDRVPNAILILLEPPTLDELARRLRGRGTESEEKIARRLAAAERELAERDWFDHAVVNDDLQRASSQVAAIIDASHSHP
ncbi:MAG: guanylate kinase [Actinomycetota bacterium]|nr:guanylate kinase [Actinomycetota bacterium]